jgi:hypothetical protein
MPGGSVKTLLGVTVGISTEDWQVREQLREGLPWMWITLSTRLETQCDRVEEEEARQNLQAGVDSTLCKLQRDSHQPSPGLPGLQPHTGATLLAPGSQASSFLNWEALRFSASPTHRWTLLNYTVSNGVGQSDKSPLIFICILLFPFL